MGTFRYPEYLLVPTKHRTPEARQKDRTILVPVRIASRQIASTTTAATAKEYSAANAKLKRIIWRAAVKATLSPTAALFVVLLRSIEQVS